MGRRKPYQIEMCDSCGTRFPKWNKVWARPDYSQIVCEPCKDEITDRAERGGFDENDLKRLFKQVPLQHLQVL